MAEVANIWIVSKGLIYDFVFFFFLPHLCLADVPKLGIKPLPQQLPEPLQ